MQIGYDPEFIGDGIRIDLPTFDRRLAQSVLRKPGVLRDEIYSDHIHFTIVMNEHTDQLIYSAYNINQSKFRDGAGGKKSWTKDSNIGKENQLGNEFYKDRKGPSGEDIPNPYDKGHMVMRFNNMWGDTKTEADKGGRATFIYANASFQHENLNRDEWKALEMKIVRDFQHDANDRLAVFTGPIYGDLDRHIHLSDEKSARVPSGFFKVVCFRSPLADPDDPDEKLGVLAFAVFQDAQVLRDKKGGATIKTDRRYQFTISELQDLTGLKFGQLLYDRNPLFYHDLEERNERFNVPSVPERIPFDQPGDLIGDANDQRCDQEDLLQRRIVINSAMINPAGDESRGEWVSLHNRGNRKTSINDWILVDGQGREGALSGSIGSGESARLKGSGKGKVKLSNSGGSLILYDNHGCLIDHVTWSRQQVARLDEGIALLFEGQ